MIFLTMSRIICLFCFFLLEVPKSMITLLNKKRTQHESQDIKIIMEDHSKHTHMEKISDDDIEYINASCSYCNNIFFHTKFIFDFIWEMRCLTFLKIY